MLLTRMIPAHDCPAGGVGCGRLNYRSKMSTGLLLYIQHEAASKR